MGQRSEPRVEASAPDEEQGGTGTGAGIDPDELARTAIELARENPHTALGAAFAVGFLLGGGLTPRLLVSIAALAGRRYFAQIARDALESAVRQQIEEPPRAS